MARKRKWLSQLIKDARVRTKVWEQLCVTFLRTGPAWTSVQLAIRLPRDNIPDKTKSKNKMNFSQFKKHLSKDREHETHPPRTSRWIFFRQRKAATLNLIKNVCRQFNLILKVWQPRTVKRNEERSDLSWTITSRTRTPFSQYTSRLKLTEIRSKRKMMKGELDLCKDFSALKVQPSPFLWPPETPLARRWMHFIQTKRARLWICPEAQEL